MVAPGVDVNKTGALDGGTPLYIAAHEGRAVQVDNIKSLIE